MKHHMTLRWTRRARSRLPHHHASVGTDTLFAGDAIARLYRASPGLPRAEQRLGYRRTVDMTMACAQTGREVP